MSHLVRMKLTLTSGKYLEEALKLMGYSIDTTKTSVSRHGDTANVDIAVKDHNLGFKKEENGTYTLLGDVYGTNMGRDKFKHELTTRYSEAMVVSKLKRSGLTRIGKATRDSKNRLVIKFAGGN